MKHFLSSALALSALGTTVFAATVEPTAAEPDRSSDYQQVIVTADPLSQSKQLERARELGTRILVEPVFIAMAKGE